MITRILVATDGSPVAQKAVKYAIDLARQTSASLSLLSVVEKNALVTQSIPAEVSPSHLIEPIENFLRSAAEACIVKAENLCRKNKIRPKSIVRSGHPVEEIIKEAHKSRASVIVLGSHGKGTIESAVLGSVTFGVIQKNTKFPVLVIRK